MRVSLRCVQGHTTIGMHEAASRAKPRGSHRFAHPVEREFARLLDEHGIAWLYEPHTFVLERDASGGIRQAFSPDFYLPEFELYVECTVKRQALTNLKRRKAAKASRSGIRVEVLYRRDIEGLARRWSLDRLAAAARGTTARIRGGRRLPSVWPRSGRTAGRMSRRRAMPRVPFRRFRFPWILPARGGCS